MSESFRCEVCGTLGRRRRGHCCPEGWLYAETKDEDPPGEVYVLGVCSQLCAEKFWLPGPGRLLLEEPDAGDTP